MLHLGELGAALAEKVLQYWMENIGRSLTNYQVILRFFRKFSLILQVNFSDKKNLTPCADRHPRIKDS